jgi:glyoxylase-like metal-dependent hydrolase (beta-lactamase superfamily II)
LKKEIAIEMKQRKKIQRWLALGGATLGVLGAGLVAKTFLPLHLETATDVEREKVSLSNGSLPDVEVNFLCCANIKAPAWLAVRGTFSLAPRSLVYGAVLIRHPKGTFLFDTGLCANIQPLLSDQPLWFRKVFGDFAMEKSIGIHLQQRHMEPQDLDFILLSHLHWDHVSGIPDLPGIPLRINRVEHKGLQKGPLAQNRSLVKRLLCDNPIELFDVDGPAYAGFQASYDLFGDGSIILVPLPGHTAGQVGMFIHRANGPHLFLIADAAWLTENYLKPAPMHPLFWSLISSDRAAALQTLIELHRFAHQYPEIPMIAMHDAPMQEAFANKEQTISQARQVKGG